MKKTITAVLAAMSPSWVQAGDWEYSVSPYLWLPTISMDSSNVRNDSNPIDGSRLELGPTDYLQALDFALMLTADMRRNDWVLLGDLIYLDFSIDDKDIDFARPGRGPIAGSYAAGLEGSVMSLAGGRTFLKRDNHHIEGLVGWRRFAMTLDISGDLISGGSFRLESDLDFNDAFIGVNGRYVFDNDRWSVRYYADIGTGESDMTWQAMVGLDYAYSWGGLYANYRHLHYDLGDITHFDDAALTFSGPSVGATFRF